MDCQIKYNSKGEIQTVYDKAGNESQLFLSIAKLPMVKTLEEALEIYKQTYAKGISDNAEIVIEGGFKSNLREALANIKDKNIKNVKGWVNQLNDFDKTGVRYTNQEMEWIGLEDFLKDWVKENKPKNGNIPFEVVDQYVKDNQIEIEEVTKGEISQKIPMEGSLFTEIKQGVNLSENGLFTLIKQFGEPLKVYYIGEGKNIMVNAASDLDTINWSIEGFISRPKDRPITNDTKYSQYTLEGGENYREILLTLPKIEKPIDVSKWTATKGDGDPASGEIWEIRDESGNWVLGIPTENVVNKDEAIRRASDIRRQPSRDNIHNYTSSHWDEKNILAHIRLNERTLPNGERVLFVEEIQSDWQSEGRKTGFENIKELENLDTKLEAIKQKMEGISEEVASNRLSVKDDMSDEAYEEIRDKNRALRKEGERLGKEQQELRDKRRAVGNTPDMPYKKTEQYLALSIRKVMQMAAQEGFDRVAWVTGEQSAERYDLSEQIESIAVIGSDINDGINKRVTLIPSDGTTINMTVGSEGEILSGDFKDKNLSDVIGKELAERVVTSPNNVRTTLEGQDLSVGGEGMKAFYNQILPKVALKEAQRFDKKAKVEVIDFRGKTTVRNAETISEMIGNLEANKNRTESQNKDLQELLEVQKATEKDASASVQKQLSIKITPRAKASLLGAVPLFSKNNSSEDVTITKSNSTNPSFEDMLDIKTKGGVLEIGKINRSKSYSILHLKVDEALRRQGIATKLLKAALDRVEGKLSGQASNDNAIGLNYNLGMRAFDTDGVELTLEETKIRRAESAGESIHMRLPESKTGENYTPFSKNNSSEEVVPAPKEMLEGLIDRLNQTSLSERNHILNEQEMVNKLVELGIPEDMAFQVVSYHGRTKPIDNFERKGKPRKRYGEILSGIYFGETYIAAAFAGVDSFSGNESGRMAKVRLDNSDFYTIDMKGTTPSGDASLINIIGGKEWDKIKALKDSGQIKGLKLLNTREFLAGEEGPTTQYVAYDNSTVEILREYAGAEINQFVPRFGDFLFSKGIQATPNGFVYKGEVYINSDKAGLDTPIHEFGHLWNSWARENKNELYKRGIKLVKEQGKKYIEFVKANQPKLKGDAILEEALAQAIGDNGAKLVEESKAGGFRQWLSDLWKSIAEAMGISQYKESEIANLSLDQFARAVAVDLLKGNTLTSESNADVIDNFNTVRMSRGSKNRADSKISVSTPYLKGEILRLSKVEEVAEDGATLNLDGTKYTGGGLVVPITSINSTQNKINTKVVEDFIEKNRDKIGSDIVKFGLYKFPEQDTVSVDLNIVIPAEYKKIALEFGRLAGQESLYNLDTGKYEPTGADGMNPMEFTAEEFSNIAASLSKGILPDVVSKGEVAEGNKKFNEPLPEAEAIAREYMESIGESYEDFQRIEKNDVSLAKAMSNTFDNLKHSTDTETVKAYEEMAEQTIAQYEAIVKHGYEIEVNNTEPYSSSGEMIEDLRQNKNMKIFSTESGFGDTAITEKQRAEDPRLRRTEFTDKNGVPLLLNDVFRFVHDFFGHAVLGNGFGPIGEENAWQTHVRMFTGDAKKAMTTETRGQNSWVNFSGVNDKPFEKRDRARALRKEGNIEEADRLTGEVYEEMQFAEQKLALSPDWMVEPDAKVEFLNEAWNNLTTKQQAEHLGYEVDKEGSKVADGEGNFKFSRRTSVPVSEVVDRSIMTPSELKLMDFWGDKPIQMYGGRSQSEGIAMYNRANKTISINVNNKLGGVVLSNQAKLNETVIHEVIHHLVNTKVQNKEDFDNEVSSIRDAIVRNKHLASPYVQNIIGHMEKGSPEEVITYALSDSAVAEFLNSVDSEGSTQEGTLWNRFVKAILDALRGNSLLGDVANVLDRYMDSMESEADYSSGEGTYYMNIEPELSFKGADSYKDALDKGEDIEIGVDTRDGFKTLITIPYNVDPETRDGFINKYIKEGFLKEERVIKNGKQYFETNGINYLDRKMKEIMLEDDLVTMLGAEGSKVKDGLIEIKEEIEKYNYTNEERAVIKDLVSELFKSNNVGARRTQAPKKLNAEELKLKLMTLLNKMGVETMSISEYVEKYNKKNGVDPSVRALADAVNRVVAFKDGIVTLEDLTEEVMHIIVETLPEAEVAGILRNIHQTTEYSQHAKQYRDIYSKAYPKLSAEEIEQLVRKEILGKVLKNSTLANMEQTDQRNFYEKALDYIKGFFERINGGKEFQDQLRDINRKIEDLFIQENLTDYIDNNLNTKVFPMYSIGSQPSGDPVLDLARGIQKSMLNSLKQSYLSVDKRFGALYADKVRVQKLEEMIDNVTQAAAASDFLGLIKRQTDFVKRAVDTARSEDTALSVEARQVLISLNDSLRILLERQRDVTNKLSAEQLGLKGQNTSEAEAELGKKALLAKIDDTLRHVSTVSGEASNVLDSTFDDILERIAIRHDLSPEKREFLKSQSEMMNKEIGFFMETFGQLIHSSDALLNVAANVVEEMWGKHTTITQKRFREFAKVMEANGVKPEEMTKLFDRGFLISEFDFPKFQNKMKEVELGIYNSIFSENVSQEEYTKMKEEGTLKRYDDAQHNTAQRMKAEATKDLVEKRMNSKYYEDQAKKYEALGVSKYTIDQLKALSLQRAIVQEAATDDSGKVIYTDRNKDDLDALSQTRKEYKSIVDSFGTLKKGLMEMSKEEATARGIDILNQDSSAFLEIGNLIYTLEGDASNEAKLSYELHLIDKDYSKNGADRNIADFVDKFVEITNEQGLEQGIKFVENNIGISFSSEFWNSISTENILDNVEVNLVPGNMAVIKRIRQKRNRLSQLKKLYQDPMNPQEIKGNEMSENEQEIIKNLVEEIDVEMENLQMPEGIERGEPADAESSVNQSYKDAISKEIKQELSKEEFKFIRKHLTSKNESYLISLESKAKALDDGTYFGSDKVKERLESYMEDGDTYYNAFVRLARTRMLPYYKRFTPTGYKTIKEVTSELTSDDIKQARIIDYISDLDNNPNYELNIHYTFDAAAQDVNPNWDKNFQGGFDQPKLSSFLNQKFVDMFDPEIVGGKFTGVVRKNQNLYNVQQALIKLQGENLESIGQKGSANVYKVPQISRTRLDQVSDFLKKSNKGDTIKEIFKDTFKYRIDDLEYGNAENNATMQRASDTRTIPIFYTRDLENAEDVTDDLFYSYLAMTNQAVLHQVRRNGITDIRAVEAKMLSRENPDGKASQATRNYKMLKSYIDYNYYGVKESTSYKVKLPIINKEVDVTKILRQLNNYVKLRNLGLNFIVPFTSYITAEVNTQIEASLGEYFSRDSLRLASREFGKLFKETGFVKNSLSYNDKSKINVLGEWLGVYDMSEKSANAKYPVMMRWFAKAGMALHQVGNFPIIPRVFLSIMFDNRVIEGKLISRKQFLEGKSDKKLAESEWKTYEGNAIYHYLDVKPSGVEIKPQLLADLNNDQEYLDIKMQRIRSLIKDQVQKIDGMIPESQRVDAQRNAVFNYLMTHRGWLAINTQRRLKGLQLNLETGQMEEGTYVTMKNLLFDFFGELGGGQDKTWNFVKAMKKAYEGSKNARDPELVKRNLKRGGVEFAFLTGIVFILAAVTAMADDEDNKDLYALQLTNYFMWRLANETSSTQLGLFTELSDVVKSPIVGYQQVQDMANIAMIFDDEYKSGTYKGHSGAYKYFFKNTVGLKSLHDLKNIKNTEKNYKFYNRDNITFSSMGIFSLLNDK